MRWFREWQQRRRERKVFEALYLLALMDDEEVPCSICDDDCQQCICGENECD